ncbi:hypothetical protein [Methanobrevibacter sp.]
MTMILTHIPDETKQNELLEAMEMEVYRDDIEELVYSIYGDELTKKDNQIKEMDKALIKKENTIQQQGNQLKQKDQELKEIKKDYSDGLQELNKMDNLPPEAKKIINSMLLLHK